MPKSLTPEARLELELLSRRMLITIDFVESIQHFATAPQLRGIVQTALDRSDLRTARLLTREIADLLAGLAPHERDGLEAVLAQRLGVDTEAERRELESRVAKAVARGVVASAKERRWLEEYADSLESFGGDESEIKRIRKLLASD